MRRRIGKRPVFFFTLAVISAALVPPTPAEFRWTAWLATGLALFWAVALALEDLLGAPVPVSSPPSTHVETPFGPPPRPAHRSRSG
jgi:hypothetical protein